MGVGGIALLILNHKNKRKWVVSAMPWLLFLQEGDPALIVQEAGWAPGSVWTGMEKGKSLLSNRVCTQDHLAESKLLCDYALLYRCSM
jgi:hypothetical protein